MKEWVETEMGKIPIEWEFDKLENHLVIKGRIGWKGLKISEYTSEGPFIIGGLQIKDRGIDWSECAHISVDRYEESPEIMLKDEDILMTKDGTIGKLGFVNNLKSKATVASHIHVIRKKNEKIDSKFLYYFFKSPVFNQVVESKITGSVIPALTQFDINNTYFPIPPKKEQQSISSILSSLDDKIDLLHRQNATLEKMAETLFRQWFVEEASEDWEETCFEKHTIVFRGISYSGNGLTIKGQGTPMHNLNSIYEGGGYKLEGIKYYNGDYKERHTINTGEIIVSATEQGHNFKLIGCPAIIPTFYGSFGLFSQDIFKIKPKGDSYLTNEFFYYLIMSSKVREQIIGASNGSSINHLSIDGLKKPTFKIPTKELVLKFTSIVKNYWMKKDTNYKQIQTLTSLRDTLLPKLMSGEVRVKTD